ncbi:MAG TPA: hypothetical protein VK943_13220 [Arenibaculum sp.]|nr:hypothetical protein [Arenibaculum sp.]
MAGRLKTWMAFASAVAGGVAAAGALLAGQLAGQPSGTPTAPRAEPFAQGELLVKFSSTMSEEDIRALNGRLGVEVIDRTRDGRFYQVRVTGARTLDDIRAAYEAAPGVEYVERAATYRIQPAPHGPPDGG